MVKKKQKKRRRNPTPKGKEPKTTIISFRAKDELLEKLDAYLAKLREESPGGNWTRSSAALNLVVKGLE